MYTVYQYEYLSVIENTNNLSRLSHAWESLISRERAEELVAILITGEGISVGIEWHDNVTSWVCRDIEGKLTIYLGQRLSVGLIFHEYAHVMLFQINNGTHGKLFTATLDMLLWRYEREWL